MFSPPAKAPKRTKKTKRKFGGKAGQNYNFFLKKADRLRDNESYSKAIKNYKKAAELAPRKGQPFVGMGWCAIDNGDIKKAIDYFHKAIFRESRLAEAYIGLGEGYKELGNTKKAKSYFKKYLQVAPKGPEANVAKTNLRKLK